MSLSSSETARILVDTFALQTWITHRCDYSRVQCRRTANERCGRNSTQSQAEPVPGVEYEQAINMRGDHPANEVFAHDYPIYAAAGTTPKSVGAGGFGCFSRLGDLPDPVCFSFCAAVPAQYAGRLHDAARGAGYALSADPKIGGKRSYQSQTFLIGRRIVCSRGACRSCIEPYSFHAPETGAANLD